jgi:hypothetical protein
MTLEMRRMSWQPLKCSLVSASPNTLFTLIL